MLTASHVEGFARRTKTADDFPRDKGKKDSLYACEEENNNDREKTRDRKEMTERERERRSER